MQDVLWYMRVKFRELSPSTNLKSMHNFLPAIPFSSKVDRFRREICTVATRRIFIARDRSCFSVHSDFRWQSFLVIRFLPKRTKTCVNPGARYTEAAASIQQHFIKRGFSAASTISLSSRWGTLHDKYPCWRSMPPPDGILRKNCLT